MKYRVHAWGADDRPELKIDSNVIPHWLLERFRHAEISLLDLGVIDDDDREPD